MPKSRIELMSGATLEAEVVVLVKDEGGTPVFGYFKDPQTRRLRLVEEHKGQWLTGSGSYQTLDEVCYRAADMIGLRSGLRDHRRFCSAWVAAHPQVEQELTRLREAEKRKRAENAKLEAAVRARVERRAALLKYKVKLRRTQGPIHISTAAGLTPLEGTFLVDSQGVWAIQVGDRKNKVHHLPSGLCAGTHPSPRSARAFIAAICAEHPNEDFSSPLIAKDKRVLGLLGELYRALAG